MIRNVPFETNHAGKCDTCQEVKMLDTMVRKQRKGLYECIDCKVDSEPLLLYSDPNIKGQVNVIETFDRPPSFFEKLKAWVFG